MHWLTRWHTGWCYSRGRTGTRVGSGGRKGNIFFPFQSLFNWISLFPFQSSFWCPSGSYTTAAAKSRQAMKEEKERNEEVGSGTLGPRNLKSWVHYNLADSLNGKISFPTHPLDIFRNSCATARPLCSRQQTLPRDFTGSVSALVPRIHLQASLWCYWASGDITRCWCHPLNNPWNAHMHLQGLHVSPAI